MVKYLKDHILEELDGAIDYFQKAIENKGSDFGWKFYKMGEMEIEHANCLLKMFNKLDRDKSVTDSEYASMYKEILDYYTNHMTKIESMKKIYIS